MKAYGQTNQDNTDNNQNNDFYSQNFDALGRVKIKVDQAGTTVTMIYDLAGRLTEKQYHTGATPASDPAQTVVITQGPTLESTDTFAYDAASRITETVKGRHGITTAHTYAADSQPLTETVEADNRTYIMSRTYDNGNRPLTHVFPAQIKGQGISQEYVIRACPSCFVLVLCVPRALFYELSELIETKLKTIFALINEKAAQRNQEEQWLREVAEGEANDLNESTPATVAIAPSTSVDSFKSKKLVK